MKKISLFAIIALAAVGTTAMAKDDAAEADKPEKKICKSERVTGSLTRVNRICMTQVEWDKLAEKTSQAVTDYTRQSARPDRQAPNSQTAIGF